MNWNESSDSQLAYAIDTWKEFHDRVRDLIDRLLLGLAIQPVELNPLRAAVFSQDIAWSDEQRRRALDDLTAFEQELAHRQIAMAIRLLRVLLRRLEREGVRAASERLVDERRKACDTDASIDDC